MTENEINVEDVADDLLRVLKKAIKQSKDTTLKSKKKIVSTEYDEELKKPTCEVTNECEEITKLKGTIDVNSLKTITGLLKEVSEMKGDSVVSSDNDKGIIVLADIKDIQDDQE